MIYTRDIEGRQPITKRISPCNCGCGGKDSWHKGEYRRVIQEQVECDEEAMTLAGHTIRCVRKGVAKFPWGKAAVGFWQTHDGTNIGWYVLA